MHIDCAAIMQKIKFLHKSWINAETIFYKSDNQHSAHGLQCWLFSKWYTLYSLTAMQISLGSYLFWSFFSSFFLLFWLLVEEQATKKKRKSIIIITLRTTTTCTVCAYLTITQKSKTKLTCGKQSLATLIFFHSHCNYFKCLYLLSLKTLVTWEIP